MATDREQFDWFGTSGSVSRRRGTLFEYGCLGATLVGLVMVLVLLVYVALDAVQPFTADLEWHLTFFLLFVLPTVAVGGYLYRRNRAAARVALNAVGLPVAGLFVGAGIALLIVNVYTPVFGFAVAMAVTLAGAGVIAHQRFRPRAGFVEELGVVAALVIVCLTGLPAVSVGGLAIPQLLSPIWAFIVISPFVPIDWVATLLTVALPIAALAAWRIKATTAQPTAGRTVGGAILVASALVALAARAIGLDASVAVILLCTIAVPTGLYVEHVRRTERGTLGLLYPILCFGGLAAAVVLVDVLGFAGPNAWLDWSFLTSSHSRFAEDAGIYPALVGSVMMIIVIALSAFPVGVGAAIYLEEYAPDTGLLGSVVTLIQVNIGNLAGVPSVVYGLLGLALFIRFAGMGTGTVVVGGLTVGLLILPIVIISAQEALRAVPDSLRQASYGMGATRWQTVRNVVIPEAVPGILTGTILALGRAIGETAPLIMIGTATTIFKAPDSFFMKFSAMPRQIYAWVSFPQPEFKYGVMAAGVVTLLVVLLSMNAAAIIIRNRYQRRA
ncbi:phosphate ABC transporter permease PstA [Haloferacaceae archaeon DSL9]